MVLFGKQIYVENLKRQWHEIFDFRCFLINHLPWAPDNPRSAISSFVLKTWRILNSMCSALVNNFGCIQTGDAGKSTASVNNTGGHIVPRIYSTLIAVKSAVNLPLESITLVGNCHLVNNNGRISVTSVSITIGQN